VFCHQFLRSGPSSTGIKFPKPVANSKTNDDDEDDDMFYNENLFKEMAKKIAELEHEKSVAKSDDDAEFIQTKINEMTQFMEETKAEYEAMDLDIDGEKQGQKRTWDSSDNSASGEQSGMKQYFTSKGKAFMKFLSKDDDLDEF
jgi:hypothetical protein